MRYFGGKARISKDLAKFLDSKLNEEMTFVDLFCGSMNVISKIKNTKKRIANDSNLAIISTYKAALEGYDFPDVVTEEDYKSAKELPLDDPLHGFILIGCSYAGKYQGGYARDKRGDDYVKAAKNSLFKKTQTLKDIELLCGDYQEVNIPDNSIVYCDIPYLNTTQYRGQRFVHENFYKWLFQQKNQVFVSEYSRNNIENLPVVWSQKSKKEIRNSNNKREVTNEVLLHWDPTNKELEQ